MLMSLQDRIALHMQSCITRGKVPDWMTTGRCLTVERQEQRKRSEQL